ncbi:MAG: DUF2634 domain-containing protein [Clostridia bacterium]|nr:DUF2634 domain-containing protein [Clostridia bacterium]
MLPERSGNDIVGEEKSYKAYKIDFETKRIGEIIDGKEALLQAVKLALMTQRYKYPVFSHSYGTEYVNLLEEGYEKAMGKVKNAISDSLKYDERIKAIDNFTFEKKGKTMLVSFRILSIYGEFDYITEVI